MQKLRGLDYNSSWQILSLSAGVLLGNVLVFYHSLFFDIFRKVDSFD